MTRKKDRKREGDPFEILIRDYFENEISAGRFWGKRECCTVRWKPKYFSRDRNADITFDVSVEFRLPGSREVSWLLLIECKNYSHAVPVDDVEEFFGKVQQVAAAKSKAVLASTASFQRATREFAKSKGIGLLRHFSPGNCKWELKRSPSSTSFSLFPDDINQIEEGLARDEFKSPVFDLYMQSAARVTNSLRNFLDDLALEAGISPEVVRKIANHQDIGRGRVPYVEKEILEDKANETLAAVSYRTGEVTLEAIVRFAQKRGNLVVKTDVPRQVDADRYPILGRIVFEPPCIEIFEQKQTNRGRQRFTLAHELAHYFLRHGRYLSRDTCEESDFSLHRQLSIEGADVARLEFQANFFASCLLMPRHCFLDDFKSSMQRLEISDRGFGALYVDEQPCNLRSLKLVTSELSRSYGVSSSAVRIRLESLGLMRDCRKTRTSHVARYIDIVDMFAGKFEVDESEE